MSLAEQTNEELIARAIELKREELDTKERIKAEKRAIRDELLARAHEDFARQKLEGAGITVTLGLLRMVVEGH